MGNYQNTKAPISRKWMQRALHMNGYMNKNDVVFMSDLCREGRETGGGGEREVGRGEGGWGGGDKME